MTDWLYILEAYAPIIIPGALVAGRILRQISKQIKLGEHNADNLERLQKAFTMLNHNSSTIVKALLAKGILEPEDVKDVEMTC